MKKLLCGYYILVICSSCSLTTWISGEVDYHKSENKRNLNIRGVYLNRSYTVGYGFDYEYIIPYQNGVMFGFLSVAEQDTSCKRFQERQRLWDSSGSDLGKTKYLWGAYTTEGDKIKIQSVYPEGPALFGPYAKVVEYHGMILSDTSFVLTEYFSGRKKIEINQHYILHKCNARPDSSYFPF